MRRIVFCADGTWDGTSNNTNVFKLFNAIQVSAGQLQFYDGGLCTDGNPIEELLGGAFGTGLFQKIKDGHTQVKRILLRNISILAPELETAVNAFDPWARDRSQYYSIAWKLRPRAESDDSFKEP